MQPIPSTPSIQKTVISRFQELPDRYLNALLLTLVLTLFVVFNKSAFHSYFSDDDCSNLALARFAPWHTLPYSLFTLALLAVYRPVGVIYYKILESTAGFHFAAYIAVLQLLHLATALMLWVFLRRLGLRPLPAALGCAFFTLHMSTIPAYWKPMYAFEVLCGFGVIAALLLYQQGRFFLSLLCAFLAFKSKEVELMLPVVLFLYECLFGHTRASGGRQWRPLIPFFLLSLSFGMQAVLMPSGPDTEYTMHLTAAALWSGLAFYGSNLFYVPFSGLIVSIGLLFLRSRFIAFGVLGFWILIFPMLGFPGRHYGAYIYVPLLLFSIAVAGVAQFRPWWAALFLVFWVPASYEQLKVERSPLLAYGYDHRPYIEQVRASLASHPAPKAVVFEGTPLDFNVWGPKGLFTYILSNNSLPVYSITEPEGPQTLRQPGAVLYVWDNAAHRLHTTPVPAGGRESSYVDFAADNPIWQLKKGWHAIGYNCRYTAPRAVITLRQPAGDSDFAMTLNFGDRAENLQRVLRVSSSGRAIGEYRLAGKGLQSFRWPVSSNAESVQDFEIQVDPPLDLPPGKPVGTNVCACGFVPRDSSVPPSPSINGPQPKQENSEETIQLPRPRSAPRLQPPPPGSAH